MLSVVLAGIAVLGNTLGGYQFAFIDINRFGSYLPAILLESMTVFGDGVFLLVLVLLFTCRHVRFHWTILFGSLLSAVVINVLKDYFAMPRPPAVLDVETFNLIGRAYQARSFPSGHSATAFLLASVCFCYTKNVYLKVTFISLAVLVALSRVLIGVHWPMDVLVGGALGIVLGVSAVMITVKWPFGVCAVLHLFILSLMVAACVVIFMHGNDYRLAMPLLYAAAGAALVQFIKDYILVK
ncbi:phosphatase PAP2 family protein [Marinomonas sp. IMCC 4694]|uniref:phosphatase PAP2 family protein n=1 Tax=Marinomonas sp. IMCC 4694 TaxID=2605432 RepID=UPI00165306D7|nr:phosphatase PAP2 family protein [Marinomonas sp. IMCC 4694]